MGTFAAVFCMREKEDAPLGGEVMTCSCEQGGGDIAGCNFLHACK